MNQIVFKNLEPSELAREIVTDRIENLADKFPDLRTHRMRTTLSMENSPFQAGPDLFTVRVVVDGSKYRNLVLSHSSSNLYQAVSGLMERILERLNRYGDKRRVRNRRAARELPDPVMIDPET
jgi:ribosome-associated translation inhibitor RaiA